MPPLQLSSQRQGPCTNHSSTTRAFPTKACVHEVDVIPGCPRRDYTSSPDIAVMLEPKSMSTLISAAANAPGIARRPARCCVWPSTFESFSTLQVVKQSAPLQVCQLSRSSESTHSLRLRRDVALFDSTRPPDSFRGRRHVPPIYFHTFPNIYANLITRNLTK